MILRHLLRRLASAVPVLALVLVLVFALARIIPGDPAETLLGPGATSQQIASLRHQMKLDRPLAVQFGAYVGQIARGDLGTSLKTHRPLREALAAKLPATIELAVAATVLALALAIPAALLAALRPGGWVDHGLRVIAIAGVSLPAFLTALALQAVLGAWLGWLPVALRHSAWATLPPITGFTVVDALLRGRIDLLGDALAHLLLPALVLASFLAASFSRLLRASLIAVLQSPHVRAARARGVPRRAILLRHALRNALVPTLPIIGIQFGDMLGGAILTETVFSWPGLGRLTVEAIHNRDYPAIQAATLVFAAIFILVSILIEMAALLLDPRLRGEDRA
jgi:ABC-type dipeptide/oligopeptide/nickel transport system permease component